MAGPGLIRGVVGQIRWSYYTAATVEQFTAIRAIGPGRSESWSLRARIVTSDTFKMAQRPLLFLIPHERGQWVATIRDFMIVNGELTAELGPLGNY